MARVTPYNTGFEIDDSQLNPGAIFRKIDGSVWKVNADGSQSPWGTGSGGEWGEASTAKYSGSGDPTGVVTPSAEGDLYVDETTPALWQATGATSADWQQIGNGGSSPGVLCSADVLLTEDETSALYTATLPVLAGTVVMEVFVTSLVEWEAPGILSVGDTENPDGFIRLLHLDGLNSYDPTAPVVASNYETVNDQGGAYYGVGLAAIALDSGTGTAGPGVRYADDDTITASVAVDTPSESPAGITVVKIVYFAPVTSLAVTKS